MRLDEISDWCMMEVASRDDQLLHRLQGLRFQRHSIARIIDWSKHRDWGMLEDDDYQRLLERYVPAMKLRHSKYLVERVWIGRQQGYSHHQEDIRATEGMAYMMMDAKTMAAYRAEVRKKEVAGAGS